MIRMPRFSPAEHLQTGKPLPSSTSYRVRFRVYDPERGAYSHSEYADLVLFAGYSDLGSIPRIIATNLNSTTVLPEHVLVDSIDITGVFNAAEERIA